MNKRIEKLGEQVDLLGECTPTRIPGRYVGYITREQIEKFAELIIKETLQIALEALTDFDYDKRMKAIEVIKEALETKDEPVAWMTINAYGDEDDIWYENPEGNLLEGWTYKPLYTTPQRTRVGRWTTLLETLKPS